MASNKDIVNVAVPFGASRAVAQLEDVCNTCGFEGAFDEGRANDAAIEIAKRELTLASVVRMLDDLSEQGLSMAYIERALDLPQRTIARWKHGEVSASGVALLRLVRSLPGLLQLAEEGYSELAADKFRLGEAMVCLERLHTGARSHGLTVNARVDATEGRIAVFAQLNMDESTPPPSLGTNEPPIKILGLSGLPELGSA